MFGGDCCGLSIDSVPSSTFWLVSIILFVFILFLFDTFKNFKNDTDSWVYSINTSIKHDKMDMSDAFTKTHLKIDLLQQKVDELSALKEKVPKKEHIEPAESETEIETEIETESETEIEE